MSRGVDFVDIDCSGRSLRIEYQWLGEAGSAQPLMVFLHEGLGSLAMWKDFPERLCRAGGYRGLVYSRPGYGRSTARAPDEHWAPDFMHRQADEVLPALLEALQLDTLAEPPLLFGHSDGASIALLYAARFPARVSAVISLAPHILVEEVTVSSIEQARLAYLQTDLKQKLGRYHADADSAFWGWNDIWLSPAFRDWNIEAEIATIACPVLAVQGIGDEYGTLLQVRGIARRVAHSRIVELAECGHSPHRDQPELLISEVLQFLADDAGMAGSARVAADG